MDYQEIDSFIEENREAILRDIGRLVAVPSTEGEAFEGAPYGEGPKKALELGLSIAEELGLSAKNCENRIGYAELSGEKEDYIATITHLDVVPAGDGWKEDPFTMRIRDNYLIGRGVMDDKGPSVLCLYALKYLKDKKIPLRYTVRALLGANEETHMADVRYYLKNYKAPVFCFSPDADFPVCNGEKGLCEGKITSKITAETVVSMNGGFAPNAIPACAEAVLKFEGKAPESTDSVAVSAENGLLHLSATGKGGHASLPEGTVNAIAVLINFILDNGLCSEAEREFFTVLKKFHASTDGSSIGADADDGRFTPLTMIGGMIRIVDGHFVQTFDSRYPTNTSGEILVEKLRAAFGSTAEIELFNDMKPFYIEPEKPEILACLNTYNEVTGEHAEFYTMGGGTYARHFPNAVSFGPEHPERPAPAFAGPVHGIDEAASIDFLLEALKIYIITLIKLQGVDFS